MFFLIKHNKKRWIQKKHVFFMCFMFVIVCLEAQFYNGTHMSFGKNRIQTQTHVWTYYRTPMADIYYYPQGKKLAEFVAENLPKMIPELEEKLRYTLSNKIQIIIYSRQSDFMESNIGMEFEDFYNTGGVTPLYGYKLFLYFDGNMRTFTESLKGGLAGLFINHIISGQGLLNSMSSANDRVAVPYWFTDGMSAYYSKSWTTEVDNAIRDGIKSGRYERLHNLSVAEQQIAGFSLWHYIADTYGEDMLLNILHYLKALKNYEKVTYVTLGIGFEQLKKEWIDYYTKRYLTHPEFQIPENSILKKYKKQTYYLQPKISPDGKYIAYLSNQEGRVKVFLYDEQTKKKKCIYRYHFKIEDNPDVSFPLLAWHPSGNHLMMMIEHKAKVYLVPYDMEERKWGARQIVFIHKITDFAYSDDGRYLALSGVNNGQSDIYLYNVASRSLQAITNDKADDFAPRFIKENTALVFSSNRDTDSLKIQENEYAFSAYDLYLYDLNEKSTTLERLTKTPLAEELYAFESEDDYLSFISDRNGVYNRYVGKFEHNISHIDTTIHYVTRFNDYSISDVDNSILFYDVEKQSKQITEVKLYHGNYVMTKEDATHLSALPRTYLNQSITMMHRDAFEEIKDSLSLLPPEVTKHVKRLRFVKLDEIKNPLSYLPEENTPAQDTTTDTEKERITFVPRVYDVQYYLNSIAVQADFSFLNTTYQQFVPSASPIYLNPGLNLFLTVQARDLMEDHRLTGGVRFSVDLNKEFLFSYEDFSKRLDKQVAVYFQSLKNMNYYGYYESQQNMSIFYLLRYPFDRVNSVRFTGFLRYNRYSLKATDELSLEHADLYSFWLGAKAEYVVDFTKNLSLNMKKGVRAKAFAEFMCTPDQSFNHMFVIGGDIRYYAKLHRHLIWANRFAASTSIGKNRLIYYMGGLDNWWFAKFNQEINVDTSINYTYQTLATNMRGFTQNIRNGTSFFVLNSELRFSIIQYFSKNPLKNNFFNSMQVVIFGDIGTAWTGLTPYSEDNSLFRRVIQAGPSMKITLNNQTEPIVAGVGLGLRFMVLGYFVRLDYAWGIENYKVNKGLFYISLNLDF
jgi:WD40 repeat protein